MVANGFNSIMVAARKAASKFFGSEAWTSRQQPPLNLQKTLQTSSSALVMPGKYFGGAGVMTAFFCRRKD